MPPSRWGYSIAEALLRFAQAVRHLSPEEQKEPVQLVVREVSVKQFDEDTNQVSEKKGALKAEIRTRSYLITISLFVTDLIPEGCQFGGKSLDLKKIGSAGMSQARTFWDHSLILAIPFSRWGAIPYIVDPIPFPSGTVARIVSTSCGGVNSKPDSVHPYHQAQLWLQEIESSQITKAEIAAREGISRARVTQVLNLLALPREIQNELQHPPVPLEIHSFRERDLRRIMACRDLESRLRLWRELVHKRTVLIQD